MSKTWSKKTEMTKKEFAHLDEKTQRLLEEALRGEKIRKRHCKQCGIEFSTLDNYLCSSKCEINFEKHEKDLVDEFKNNKELKKIRADVFKADREIRTELSKFTVNYNKLVSINNRLRGKHNKIVHKASIPERTRTDYLLSDCKFRHYKYIDDLLLKMEQIQEDLNYRNN